MRFHVEENGYGNKINETYNFSSTAAHSHHASFSTKVSSLRRLWLTTSEEVEILKWTLLTPLNYRHQLVSRTFLEPIVLRIGRSHKCKRVVQVGKHDTSDTLAVFLESWRYLVVAMGVRV